MSERVSETQIETAHICVSGKGGGGEGGGRHNNKIAARTQSVISPDVERRLSPRGRPVRQACGQSCVVFLRGVQGFSAEVRVRIRAVVGFTGSFAVSASAA